MKGKPGVVHHMTNMMVKFGILLVFDFFLGPGPNGGRLISGGFFAIVDLQHNRQCDMVRIFLNHALQAKLF